MVLELNSVFFTTSPEVGVISLIKNMVKYLIKLILGSFEGKGSKNKNENKKTKKLEKQKK